ncbi:hypothetical protein WHZ77_06050 [Bradyrhizobium sp. A5]|uniref:hypothetical protein n=1 Tax=Bradyrhizobium sp. A5 TaxID=3133696 RepID=UPI00324E4EC5
MGEFKQMRREMFFKPAGEDKWQHLGHASEVTVRETITIGNRTISHVYRPGDVESTEKATNELARFVMGKDD